MRRILRWRQLIVSLALKDLKTKYRQATGGFGWMLIMPLVQAVIFYFIFGFLFRIKVENYALFLLSGLFPWGFLRGSLECAANSIINNAGLVKQACFPREIIPFSNIITSLIAFFVSLIILLIFAFFLGASLSKALLWLPLIILIQAILTVGISLFFTGLNTVYRETQFIMNIFILIWFYATPIIYPLNIVSQALSERMFRIYSLNPMVGIISAYQQVFVYQHAPDLRLLLISIIISIFILILGWFVFSRYEDIFADIV